MRRRNLAQLTALCLAVTAGLASAQYLETAVPLSYQLAQALWNPANNRVYVSNCENGSITVIDGATNQIVTTIGVAGVAYSLCLNSAGDRLYCAADDTVSIIDTGGDTLLRSFRVRGPTTMVCDRNGNKLYVDCPEDGLVRVYDAASGTLVREIAFGQNTPCTLLPYPGTSHLFCATEAGGTSDTVFVMDSETDSVVGKTAVGSGPRQMCWNPPNGLVYVDCTESIYALSPAGDSVVAVIPLAHNPGVACLCAVPSLNKLYAARGFWVYAIDCDSQAVTRSFHIPYVSLIACDAGRDKVYCTCRPVQVYDARGDSVLLTIPVDAEGYGFITWNCANSRMYMTNPWYDTVFVIRDTTTGVAEPGYKPSPKRSQFPTVCQGVLQQYGDATAVLLDLTGRQAVVLKPGSNDVRGLKSGVYFVRSDKGALTQKVIIQN
jgi:YVTN family beta-propeller protein